MDMQTLVTDWKQNATGHKDRNFAFLHSLKDRSERAVDQAARRPVIAAYSIFSTPPLSIHNLKAHQQLRFGVVFFSIHRDKLY